MITPGQILLNLYYKPVGKIRESIRNGGPIAQWQTEQARREMEAAAHHLPELPDFRNAAPGVLHVMTGRKFWYQTAYCLHSLSRTAETTLFVELYDDGTIDAECERLLRRMGPRVRIHPFSEALTRLDRHLPAARFPVLRERWLNYPNIRKMTDVHLGGGGWKLVIDSDLLFFRRPEMLLRWLVAPDRPFHAVDCEESYGYSRRLMEQLAGAPIPPLVNVGMCGLRSDSLNWTELEAWCAELIDREKTNYYLEQALVAMLMAREPSIAIAPAKDYITMPTQAEVQEPKAVMHHYVSTSKRWYFRNGWRRVLS